MAGLGEKRELSFRNRGGVSATVLGIADSVRLSPQHQGRCGCLAESVPKRWIAYRRLTAIDRERGAIRSDGRALRIGERPRVHAKRVGVVVAALNQLRETDRERIRHGMAVDDDTHGVDEHDAADAAGAK